MMTALPRLFSLNTLLRLDAATCAGMGLALALAPAQLGAWTQIPAGLLFYAGLALLPVAAFIALVAARPSPSAQGARAVILGNVGWVAASVLLLLSGWIAPNGIGVAFIAGQALAVALLTWLEYSALTGRRAALQVG